MKPYLQSLVDQGVITVEYDADGNEVVRMTPKSMELMMSPAPLTGKAAERLEKMVKKYESQ